MYDRLRNFIHDWTQGRPPAAVLPSRSLPSFVLALLALPCVALAQPATVLESPDHRTQVALNTEHGQLSFSIRRDQQVIIADSSLGLQTSVGSLDGANLRLLGVQRESVHQTYRPVVGKAASVADHYNQLTLHFAASPKALQFDLLVRVYDGGVALRYVLPQQEQVGEIGIHGEATRFVFPANYRCWGYNPGQPENAHEGEFDPVAAAAIRPSHLYDAPLVCKTGQQQTTFALAEADKRDYAGAYFSGRGEGGLGVQVSLAPQHGGVGYQPPVRANLAKAALVSPWRVVMLADTPGGLAASSLIATLGSPSVLADTSWIKPGKAAWDWWNGWAVNLPDAGVNTATYRAYTDFAAQLGLEYILIDEGWYEGSAEWAQPANVLQPIAKMDMPAIVAYARERNVGVWLWLQWEQLDRQLDQALAQYAAWGIKGIKVDFMNRNDQDMVAFYHKLLSKAAQHHLMVDLHAAYPPDGLQRTYPNYMTQEGVMGAEYNKWSSRVSATHNVTLPFTRMILGPIDYTPGGFRSLAPKEFTAQLRNVRPYVQTTRGQAVAMYVVYDSPLTMVADNPEAYKNADGSWADGAQFIGQVPTSWDETRVLAGDIGQYIVTARRKGERWYLGAMTNEQARKLKVDLNFLMAGRRYRAEILQDGKDRNHLKASTAQVDQRAHLDLQLADGGGAVVVLTPLTAGGAP